MEGGLGPNQTAASSAGAGLPSRLSRLIFFWIRSWMRGPGVGFQLVPQERDGVGGFPLRCQHLRLHFDRRTHGIEPLFAIDPRPAQIGQRHLASLVGIGGGLIEFLSGQGSPRLPADGGSQLRIGSMSLAVGLDLTIGAGEVVLGDGCAYILDDSGEGTGSQEQSGKRESHPPKYTPGLV